MRRPILALVCLLTCALLCLLTWGCQTEIIELRDQRPDARAIDAEPGDAEPARCVCLRGCVDSRDCGGIGSEICDTGAAVCEEADPLLECASSASCIDGRTCVREEDPTLGCP